VKKALFFADIDVKLPYTTRSVTTIVVTISLVISPEPITTFDRGRPYPEKAIFQRVPHRLLQLFSTSNNS